MPLTGPGAGRAPTSLDESIARACVRSSTRRYADLRHEPASWDVGVAAIRRWAEMEPDARQAFRPALVDGLDALGGRESGTPDQ